MNDFSPSLWSDGQQDHAVETPEQVSLHLPLAGLGSRFLAVMVDMLIQSAANLVLIIVVVLVFSAVEKAGELNHVSDTAAKWFTAGIILFYFALYWGYFSLFEAFRNGQTPGKRVMKIRVIKDSGRQITFFEALARNLLRVVDWLPGIYLVGTISILFTKQNKRLGDLVADTIVVHERAEEFSGYLSVPMAPGFGATPFAAAPELQGIPADRIGKLAPEDLLLIDSYLARAFSLPIETRAQLASRLLDGLCAKMDVPVPMEIAPERTLEALAYALRGYGSR